MPYGIKFSSKTKGKVGGGLQLKEWLRGGEQLFSFASFLVLFVSLWYFPFYYNL